MQFINGRIKKSLHRRKEVRISINKSGLDAYGKCRYVLAARFADCSYNKVTDTGYVGVEVDSDTHRLYFVRATSENGFKLTSSGKANKSISFSIKNTVEWEDAVGCYYLLKDVSDNSYYIDFSK